MTDEEIERTTEAVARSVADGDEAVYEQTKRRIMEVIGPDRRMLRRIERVEKWMIRVWIAAAVAVVLLLLWNQT